MSVPAARIEKSVKTRNGKSRSSKKTVVNRRQREAVLHVSAAPIRLCAPSTKYGEHGNQSLSLWIVRVWEPNPPEGVEPLEWFLLTNHPVSAFADAWDVVSWYECRWIIEEYHKAQKTVCGIQNPQFTKSDLDQPKCGREFSIAAEVSRHARRITRAASEGSHPPLAEYASLRARLTPSAGRE